MCSPIAPRRERSNERRARDGGRAGAGNAGPGRRRDRCERTEHGPDRDAPACHQHHPYAVHRRRASGQFRAIRARPWRSRPWSTRSGIVCCVSTRRTRSGPTAIASCSPTAMHRCCCGRVLHLTGTRAVNAEYETARQARGHARRHQAASANSTARRRATPNTIGFRAWRPPPARSGRVSPTASAWPSPRSGLPRATTGRGFDIFDFDIYAVCGDGCLMEGVASEAASLAGHLGLDNLCWIYDNNHITIEGNTRITFTEDVAARFLGYGWNVLRVGDANDIGPHRARTVGLPADQGPADPDHPRQPHRLRIAASTGHGRGARRAARRRGGTPDQARLWLARRCQIPGSRWRARTFRGRHW